MTARVQANRKQWRVLADFCRTHGQADRDVLKTGECQRSCRLVFRLVSKKAKRVLQSATCRGVCAADKARVGLSDCLSIACSCRLLCASWCQHRLRAVRGCACRSGYVCLMYTARPMCSRPILITHSLCQGLATVTVSVSTCRTQA